MPQLIPVEKRTLNLIHRHINAAYKALELSETVRELNDHDLHAMDYLVKVDAILSKVQR